MVLEIDRRHCQGIGRDVGGINSGIGKMIGCEDGKTCRARADIQNRFDGFIDQGFAIRTQQALHQQLTDIGAGDDDTFIDVKGNAMHVSALEKIGGGLAGGNARLNDGGKCCALFIEQAGIKPRIDVIYRQMQGFKNDEGCFIDDAGGAMAMHNLCRPEAADGIAQEIADGMQVGNMLGHGGELDFLLPQ